MTKLDHEPVQRSTPSHQILREAATETRSGHLVTALGALTPNTWATAWNTGMTRDTGKVPGSDPVRIFPRALILFIPEE